MGMTSARALAEVARIATQVLAIEALVAGQGLSLRSEAPGVGVGRALAVLRAVVPPLDDDRVLSTDIAAAAGLVGSGALLAAADAR